MHKTFSIGQSKKNWVWYRYVRAPVYCFVIFFVVVVVVVIIIKKNNKKRVFA